MGARKQPHPSPRVPVGDPTDPHSLERHLAEWLADMEVHNFAVTIVGFSTNPSDNRDSGRKTPRVHQRRPSESLNPRLLAARARVGVTSRKVALRISAGL